MTIKGKGKIPPLLIFVLTSILLLMLGLAGLSENLNPFLNSVYSPVTLSSAKLGSFFNTAIESIGQIDDIRQERNDLLVENAILKAENSSLLTILEEVDLLRAELKIPRSENFSPVDVRVVSSRNDQIDNYILINRGTSSALSDDETVRVGLFYVGRIKDTSNYTARVELPTYSNSFLEVTIIPAQERITDLGIDDFERMIASTEKIVWKGVAVGIASGVEVQNIEKNATINNGDHVLITDEDVSRVLYLGDISEVIQSASDIGTTAKVRLPVNYSNLTNLIVDRRVE